MIKSTKKYRFAVFFGGAWLQLEYSRDRANALQTPFTL